MYGYLAFYLTWSPTCCLVSESSISKMNKSFYNANCILVVLYLLLLLLTLWKHEHTICRWLEFNSRWLATKSWKGHSKTFYLTRKDIQYVQFVGSWMMLCCPSHCNTCLPRKSLQFKRQGKLRERTN